MISRCWDGRSMGAIGVLVKRFLIVYKWAFRRANLDLSNVVRLSESTTLTLKIVLVGLLGNRAENCRYAGLPFLTRRIRSFWLILILWVVIVFKRNRRARQCESPILRELFDPILCLQHGRSIQSHVLGLSSLFVGVLVIFPHLLQSHPVAATSE